MTPKVLDTLAVLVASAGRPVSKDDLRRAVWPDTFVEEGNLTQNVSVLRKSLGSSGGPYIETLPKRGYRFVAEVRTIGAGQREFPNSGATAPSGAAGEAVRNPKHSVRIAGAALLITLLTGGAVFTWRFGRLRGAVPEIHSLAVLPFSNLSKNPEQDRLADGITDVLTEELSSALPVRVTSGTSAMVYKNRREAALPAIARKLQVDGLVEGSVLRTGNRVRVTVELIHAATSRHLWADSYDRDVADVVTLQMEIARSIAHEIGTVQDPGVSRRPRRVNPEAFEAYIRGRYYLERRTGTEIDKAVRWFQQAIEADPAYAAAYAGLADCYNQIGTVAVGGRSPAESRKLARAAAKRALEIEPRLAEAHTALAYSDLYDWNWSQAKEGFERAIALNPNYAPAHLWLAHYHAARAEFARAQQQVHIAADLDPLSPIIQTQTAWLLGYARRFREAIVTYRAVLAVNPDYPWALSSLGGALIETGDYQGGIGICERVVKLGRTPSALGGLARAYAAAGRTHEATKLLDEALAISHSSYVPPHVFVSIYAGLGERDKAFEWMERSYQEKSNSLAWLKVGAVFDPLRSDPRFDVYLRRVGLR